MEKMNGLKVDATVDWDKARETLTRLDTAMLAGQIAIVTIASGASVEALMEFSAGEAQYAGVGGGDLVDSALTIAKMIDENSAKMDENFASDVFRKLFRVERGKSRGVLLLPGQQYILRFPLKQCDEAWYACFRLAYRYITGVSRDKGSYQTAFIDNYVRLKLPYMGVPKPTVVKEAILTVEISGDNLSASDLDRLRKAGR